MRRDPALNFWWWATGAALAAGALAPALAPLVELAALPAGWSVWSESERIADLARTSILVCTGAGLLALPIGTLLGLLLARTDLPGRRVWLALFLLALFLPAPVAIGGWQTFWSSAGLPRAEQAWARLLAAAGLHAVLALPWVALITGLGFLTVEPELEEEALLLAPPWRVFRRVTLPRCRGMAAAAAFWVLLMTWQEIAVTDLFRVRTFAEEVYLQFSSGRDELARAVAVALPVTLLVMAGALACLAAYRRRAVERYRVWRSAYRYPLGRVRWPAVGLCVVLLALVLAAPVWGLCAKAGLQYSTAARPGPPTWSGTLLLERLGQQLQRKAWLLTESSLQALAAGGLASLGALWILFLVRGRPRLELLTMTLAAGLLALPGPILGLGLLAYIEALIQVPGLRWLAPFLYDRPSPLPVIWVLTLRYAPLAGLMLWPVVRATPRAFDEEAWLNHAGPLQRFALVYFRPLRLTVLAAALALATLALGEISASKLVATPGLTFEPLAHHLFQLMHSSADAELAALSLWLLLLAGGGTALFGLACRLARRRL
jgi:iron(III) transport system permease protein